MSILTRLKSWSGWFTGSQQAPPPVMGDGQYALPWRQPPSVSSARLLALYEDNDDLRKVVNLIASRFASVQWKITKGNAEVSDSDKLARMWRRPNPEMTGSSFRRLLCTYLDLEDECFVHVVRDGLTGAYELYPLPPSWVTVEGRVNVDGQVVRVFDVLYPNGKKATLTEEHILWMRRPSPRDPYGRGHGLGYAAADPAETSEYAGKYVKAFFYNDATPATLVYVPGLGVDDGKRLSANWRNRHRGADKAFGIEFLGGGQGDSKITAHQLQTSLKDLTIPEIGRQAGDAVRELYGVPPELVGQLENSNRATITEALAILGVLVLQPRLEWFECELNERLLPMLGLTGYRLSADVPIPANTSMRAELMRALPGHFSRNEVRAAAELAPVKGGDKIALSQSGYEEIELSDIEEMRTIGSTKKAAPAPPPLPPSQKLRVRLP